MDEKQPQDQMAPAEEPAEAARPQSDWTESEWFQRWLKLARREQDERLNR
jgi:hypothetical protein